MRHKTKVFTNTNDLFYFAAQDFKNRAITAVNEKNQFFVVLAGGQTPKLFFEALTKDSDFKKNIPWQQIRFFFGDERCVCASDARSNFYTAQAYLFSKVGVKADQVYSIPTAFEDPKEAAKAYEKTLKEVCKHATPCFDLAYLGLGEDAHTASLMPFNDIVKNYINASNLQHNQPLVAASFVEKFNMHRITLTPSALNQSQDVIFLVTGGNKADALQQVIEGEHDPLSFPAQLVHGKRETLWLLDQAAAQKLSSEA